LPAQGSHCGDPSLFCALPIGQSRQPVMLYEGCEEQDTTRRRGSASSVERTDKRDKTAMTAEHWERSTGTAGKSDSRRASMKQAATVGQKSLQRITQTEHHNNAPGNGRRGRACTCACPPPQRTCRARRGCTAADRCRPD
jgi:hypothetical protein